MKTYKGIIGNIVEFNDLSYVQFSKNWLSIIGFEYIKNVVSTSMKQYNFVKVGKTKKTLLILMIIIDLKMKTYE